MDCSLLVCINPLLPTWDMTFRGVNWLICSQCWMLTQLIRCGSEKLVSYYCWVCLHFLLVLPNRSSSWTTQWGVPCRSVHLLKVLQHLQNSEPIDWSYCDAWFSSISIQPAHPSFLAPFSDDPSSPRGWSNYNSICEPCGPHWRQRKGHRAKGWPCFSSQLECQVETSFSASVLSLSHEVPLSILCTNRKVTLPLSLSSGSPSHYPKIPASFSSVSQKPGPEPWKSLNTPSEAFHSMSLQIIEMFDCKQFLFPDHCGDDLQAKQMLPKIHCRQKRVNVQERRVSKGFGWASLCSSVSRLAAKLRPSGSFRSS